MTQEEKQLLLKDLCARLFYGVKVQYDNEIYNIDYISTLYEEIKLDIPDNYTIGISDIKPYLRPMSSMTEEEEMEFINLTEVITSFGNNHVCALSIREIDWLNKKMFDYRGLIEKGLALEALEGMYNNKGE